MSGDSEIVMRIRKGDVKEFEALFRSSYVSLVRYAGTIISDRDTCEEIVQDLFYRLWQNRETLSIESSLNGYLFRSVHNRCLHHISHLKVVEKHSAELASEPEPVADSPSDILQYKELQEKIAGLIESLPPRCGQIFCMSRFEGLRYSEIAGRLAVSVKTVEAEMGRALKVFRKELTIR